MPQVYALVSSVLISREEFALFAQSEGGIIDAKDETKGYIASGDKYIWISLADDGLDESEQQELNNITEKLHAQPVTCVLLEVSRTKGSDQIAINFSLNFSKRWGSVVYDFDGKIYTVEDLERMRDLRQEFL